MTKYDCAKWVNVNKQLIQCSQIVKILYKSYQISVITLEIYVY